MLPSQCEGCGNASNTYFVFNSFCQKLDDPDKGILVADRQHTRVGGCHLRTHGLTLLDDGKGPVNPLKASKRAAAGTASKKQR